MAEREKRYTEGPWWAGPTEDAHVVAEVGHYSVYPSGGTLGEPDADAHLCAAAPELLEAAEKSLHALNMLWGGEPLSEEEYEAIRACERAIAKAYGEGDNQ